MLAPCFRMCPLRKPFLLIPLPQVHDGSFTPTDQFRKDPDSLCSTISWRDEEDRVTWVYKIQVGEVGGGEGTAA